MAGGGRAVAWTDLDGECDGIGDDDHVGGVVVEEVKEDHHVEEEVDQHTTHGDAFQGPAATQPTSSCHRVAGEEHDGS